MPMSATPIPESRPLRVVQVGAGGMGRNWIRTIMANPDVQLVGLVDLNLDAAQSALAAAGIDGVVTGTGLAEVTAASRVDAVVNVTVPAAHHPVNVEALFAGYPVLCEKPVAPTVAEGLSLAAASEVSGQLLMISQSRRYYRTLAQFRQQAGMLGDIGILATEFFKAPHFGGFREEMEHVLLVDMAIHAFDAARYILDQDPVSVYCEEFNPAWSWYSGAAAASAVFEMSGGTRFTYTGSWCSGGFETSWNGRWRVSGERGSALWDGESAPQLEVSSGLEDSSLIQAAEDPGGAEEIAAALAGFVTALRTGTVPSGEVHSNVPSLAMVEAAVRSAETHQRVSIHDVLSDAYQTALRSERREDVLAALQAWESPVTALGSPDHAAEETKSTVSSAGGRGFPRGSGSARDL